MNSCSLCRRGPNSLLARSSFTSEDMAPAEPLSAGRRPPAPRSRHGAPGRREPRGAGEAWPARPRSLPAASEKTWARGEAAPGWSRPAPPALRCQRGAPGAAPGTGPAQSRRCRRAPRPSCSPAARAGEGRKAITLEAIYQKKRELSTQLFLSVDESAGNL